MVLHFLNYKGIIFFRHYGRMIEMFGPPTAYWTARFESKVGYFLNKFSNEPKFSLLQHRIAKSIAESTKNVKNITKTISEREQMRASSVFYYGMYNSSKFTLPEAVTTKEQIKNDEGFLTELRRFMNKNDIVCNSVIYEDQTYKNNDIIITGIEDCDSLEVGVIKTILVKNDEVYFVVQLYRARRKWLQYFETDRFIEAQHKYVHAGSLVDYKPLILRGTFDNFVFTLHHHISFDYV